MRRLFVLVALLGLAVPPSMASEPADLALVPAGEFTMGSEAGDSDEKPERKVYVDAFLMDKYEVTVGQYAAFLQDERGRTAFGLEDNEPTCTPEAPSGEYGFGGCGRVLQMGQQAFTDRGRVGEGSAWNRWPPLSMG